MDSKIADNTLHNFGAGGIHAVIPFFPGMSFRNVGICSVLVYGFTGAFFSCSTILRHHVLVNVFTSCMVLLLMWLYVAGLRALQSEPEVSHGRIISAVAAISGLLLLAMPPFDSTDMYAYVNAGWLQHYGLNPYVSYAINVPGWQSEQDFSAIYAYEPSIYGFLFTSICKVVCQLGHGSLEVTLLLFKAGNLLAYGVCGLLVYALAKALKISSPHLSLYLFLWNPLILLEFIGNGHNDILMILFLLLAFYLVVADRWFWVFPVLLCSVMIKFTSVVLVPFIFLYCIKTKRLPPAVAGFVPACVILWLISAPYLPGLRQVHFGGMSAQYTMTSGCVYQVVSEIYKMLVHLFPFLKSTVFAFEALVREALTAVFALFCAVAFYQAARDRHFSLAKLISLSALLCTLLVCFASSKFYPWYQGMLIPLALCLQPGHWLRVLVITLSWFQMLSFTFIEQAHVLNYAIMTVLPAWWLIRRYGLFSGSWADFNIPEFAVNGRQEKAQPDLLL